MTNKKQSLEKATVIGSFYQVFAALIQKLGGLIFTIIIARALLPEGLGIYSLALSVTLIFSTIARGGIHNALIRYISESIKKKNKKKESSTFRYILKIKLITLIVISIILLLLAYPISTYFFKLPALFLPLIFAIVYMFISSLESFFTAFFFAAKKVQHTTTKETIYQILRISLVALMIYALMLEPRVTLIFIAMIFAASVTFLFVLNKIGKENSYLLSYKEKIKRKDKNRIFKFIIFVTFTSLTYAFLGHIDTIMLGALLNDAKFIGYYNAAFVLLSGVAGFLTFNKVLMPIFVQVKGKNLENAFNKALRYNFMITVPAAVGLGYLSSFILSLLFGKEYISAAPALYVLSILVVVGIYLELLTSLFAVKEKPGAYLSLLVFVVIINIILNFVLIKFILAYTNIIPIIGAAIATSLSSIIYAIGLTIMTKSKLNIKVNLKSAIKPVLSALIMLLSLIVTHNLLGEINLLSGIFLIILGGIVYFITMFTLKGITLSEINLIKSDLLKK